MYAIVENGVVINTVVWDGKTEWAPPQGTSLVDVGDLLGVGIGCMYDGKNFTAPAVESAGA
ncbi:hypothetical protein K2O51_22910 [Cupriavidus pinatubonensis]|uniref:hypothetical protein n=1 Tax=Cupriavidus pinatubonensis TaxID=248026 RepID=UPI001C73A7BE|nr:hypothetical protein [Cupriavidus pinatubonensis]QYY30226.1 hypothetical protein K2O51_22910 [Cupriavidus pinatubonensis]